MRWNGLPERSGPPPAARRRMKPWTGATTTQCCLVSFGRLSAGPQTGRGEGVSYHTNARKPVDRLQRSSGRSTQTCVSPVENPTFAAFEEYEEVPETVPLDFTEDDVPWVTSKLSGAAGALGADAIEL